MQSSEVEAFVVDLRLGDPKPVESGQDALHHAGRPADIDVSVKDVWNQTAQSPRVEWIGRHLSGATATDQVMDRGSPQAGQFVQLVAEDHFVLVTRPVDQSQVPALGALRATPEAA